MREAADACCTTGERMPERSKMRVDGGGCADGRHGGAGVTEGETDAYRAICRCLFLMFCSTTCCCAAVDSIYSSLEQRTGVADHLDFRVCYECCYRSRCCVRLHVLVHIAERASRFPPKTKSDFGGRVKCTQLDCGSEKYCFNNYSPSFAVRRTMHLLRVNGTHLVYLVLHPGQTTADLRAAPMV